MFNRTVHLGLMADTDKQTVNIICVCVSDDAAIY